MKPFFGAKIRGNQNLDNTESILDSKQGYGSQSFSKVNKHHYLNQTKI